MPKHLFCILIIFISCTCYITAEFSAKAYCVIDVANNKIVKSKEQQTRLPVASTAKLLTAMIVIDKVPLEQIFTVSTLATQQAPTKIDLHAQEQISCKNLLIALLVHSANDAAIILAEGTSGSVEKFAEEMNKKATTLSFQQSFFVTPNGLPHPNQYTCAYDQALLGLNVYKNYPLIREILAMQKAEITTVAGRKLPCLNKNDLLKNNPPIYGKTGYTIASEHSFVGFGDVNGKPMIIAVLGVKGPRDNNLWDTVKFLLDLARVKQPDTTKSVLTTKNANETSLKNTPKNIQMILQKAGYYTGKIDGKIGPKTLEAIKKFQQDYKLKVDGKVGPQTWGKLLEVYQGKATKPEPSKSADTKTETQPAPDSTKKA